MEKFNFLNQHEFVEDLLGVCCEAMDHLPPDLYARMVAAIAPFMRFAYPMAWGIEDVNATTSLTEDEKRLVLSRFVLFYNCKDEDWEDLRGIEHDVIRERGTPFTDARTVLASFFTGIQSEMEATP